MNDVIIIGGGLAGLVNAILLAEAGIDVLVIEKKRYPFHRVCGEYISNEVLPFLKKIGADPTPCNPSNINTLFISSPSGRGLELPLETGGFGVSRYTYDNYLYWLALTKKVKFMLSTTVTKVHYENNRFRVSLSSGETKEATFVVGSYGKRSNLDRQLNRKFFTKESPYIGVKYHIKTDFPEDVIALHNFKDGYCGLSKIEDEKYTLCYLSSKENLQRSKNLKDMEESILYKNPYLEHVFTNSEFLFKKPEVINEISFEPKPLVENHILMCGDSAGMITPLCGNGMAMAIHSAKILGELIIKHYLNRRFNRAHLEQEYKEEWRRLFSKRLAAGRTVQQFFGSSYLSNLLVGMIKMSPAAGKFLIRQTHGQVVD